MSILQDSGGFTREEVQRILHLKYPTKAPQAIDPAVSKFGRLVKAHPRKAFMLLVAALDYLDQEEFEAETMPRLEAMKRGRLDRETESAWREIPARK